MNWLVVDKICLHYYVNFSPCIGVTTKMYYYQFTMIISKRKRIEEKHDRHMLAGQFSFFMEISHGHQWNEAEMGANFFSRDRAKKNLPHSQVVRFSLEVLLSIECPVQRITKPEPQTIRRKLGNSRRHAH